MEKIKTIKEFNDTIEKDGLIIVKFYGTWCAPCRMLSNIIENIIPSLKNVYFYEIDVDDVEGELLDKYSIQSVPALLYFKDGLQVDKTIGVLSASALLEKIKENSNK